MTKRPKYIIRYGSLTKESEDALKEWLRDNVVDLIKKVHEYNYDMNELIPEFVETVYDELTYAGYQEGSDAADFERNEEDY